MALADRRSDVAAPSTAAITSALDQFDRAAEHLDLDGATRAMLRAAKREWTVRFPVRMDDGRVDVLTGYRVQHNLSRGPAKGGMRFHPSTDLTRYGRSRCG